MTYQPWPLAMLCFALSLLSGCSSLQDQLYQQAIGFERHRAQLTTKTVNISDHTLIYLEGGSGPTLLLVHGFGANKDNWTRFAGRLTHSYHVIAPDLPGHGDSSHSLALNYDIETQTARLREFSQALDLQQPHLVGNSMGGAIALFYAGLFPDDTGSLILINSAGVDAPQQSEFFAALEQGTNLLIVRQPGDLARLSDYAMAKPPFIPWPLPQVIERQYLSKSQLNSKIFDDIQTTHQRYQALANPLGFLDAIQVPTLIIWGEEDRILDVSSTQIFKQAIPQAHVHILPGLGHAPMLEAPQQTAALVDDFIHRQTTP